MLDQITKILHYFLFNVAITNTYVLLLQFIEYPIKPIKDYRIQVVKLLIGDYCSRRRPGQNGGLIFPLPLRLFPIKISNPNHQNWHKRGRCERCKAANKQVDTIWWCQECAVLLCHTGDFETPFHNVVHSTCRGMNLHVLVHILYISITTTFQVAYHNDPYLKVTFLLIRACCLRMRQIHKEQTVACVEQVCSLHDP